MAEEILFYSDLSERKTLIDSIESQGKSILHDDFLDGTGKTTDGQSGKLTFDVIPDRIPTAKETRDKELIAKLKDDTITDSEVKEFLKLRFTE